MPKKKHHMTKHEYQAYSKTRRHRSEIDEQSDGFSQTKLTRLKSRKKRDADLKKQLRNIQQYAEDGLEDGEDVE